MVVELGERDVDIRGLDFGVKSTLPGRDYWAPEVFEIDRERIFHSMWVCVGREEAIPGPGDYFVRDVIDESLIVLRDQGSHLRAFYNVCRHRGSRLCDAEGSLGSAIRCPYHSWTYSLEGRLIGTPNVGKVEGFDREDYPLHAVALETWQGFIFVNLSPSPPPLKEQLEPPVLEYSRYGMDALRMGPRIVYEVAANWKIVHENYNECLHCPGVHPELVKLVPIYRRGIVGEMNPYGATLDKGVRTFTPDGASKRPPLRGLMAEDRQRYYGVTVFPNLLLNLLPDYVMAYTIYPMGPERTAVVSEYLFDPSTMALEDFDAGDAFEFWDLVSRQDWAVCERTQKGVRSRSYKSGVYPPQDRYVYEFNQQYLKARDG